MTRVVDVQMGERIVGDALKIVQVVVETCLKVQAAARVVIEQVKIVGWVVQGVAQWDTEECLLTEKNKVTLDRSSVVQKTKSLTILPPKT